MLITVQPNPSWAWPSSAPACLTKSTNIRMYLTLSDCIWHYVKISHKYMQYMTTFMIFENTWPYLWLSGTILDSGTLWDYLVLSRTIWPYLTLSGTIWPYLTLSGTIWNYLGLFRTISTIRVQVKTGESKLLLFETFSLFFYYNFFSTRAISRGARAPKNGLWILPHWLIKLSLFF